MSLFIFQPHKNWEYCGGAIGVMASSFNEAVILIKQNKDYEDHEFLQFDKDDKDTSYLWILTHEFNLCGKEDPIVVFANWNYA